MTQETRSRLQQIQLWLQKELNACIDFWLTNGMDSKHGGVYTCLDRTGAVYSTDKSVWMQGRCAWTFSHLCRLYGEQAAWRNAAESCLLFLEQHCINREAANRMYFTVTAQGHPLRQRRYCFSEAFYAIANAEYYALTEQPVYLERARAAYQLIYQLNHGQINDPVGLGSKTIVQTRALRSLADPMIFLNITDTLRRADPAHIHEYNTLAQACTHDILQYHYRPELKCTLESVNQNGQAELDYTAGRVVNPGHDLECSWFIMQEANTQQNTALHSQALQILRFALDSGWDEEYGGLLYFTDCLGKPTEAYEHDMKLWWPHNEALIACMMAYRDTGDAFYLQWFEKILSYCQQAFVDSAYGEWYGYLRRDGKPTMPAVKGSTFKGPFHLPRMLSMTDQMLHTILDSTD